MTEGLSLAGQAEMPVVIMMGQRAGPSTGLPTYTAQADLHFILNAGQGEFPRFVVAPGDAEDAYYWSGVALNMAWKYQVPSFILSDKSASEGLYSFDVSKAGDVLEEAPAIWEGQGKYNRYKYTETGVSPLAYPPQKGQVIKADGYGHDEYGITSEDPKITAEMADKRLLKGESLAKEMENYETVKIYGNSESKTALLCWGSNKGVCIEAAEKFGLKVIQVMVLSPFPASRFCDVLSDVEKMISVECNSTGQLARLTGTYGYPADVQILKYDGRPFLPERSRGRPEEGPGMNPKDLGTYAKNTWCPGCGNFSILNAMKAVLAQLDEEGFPIEKVVLVWGIGCHGKIVDYLNVNSFYSIHGRTLPVATAIKLANPDLKVICFSGDGDSLAEGLDHLIFAAKRNIDITLILHDNRVYGLTTGQYTPTSPLGFKGKSTPRGNGGASHEPTGADAGLRGHLYRSGLHARHRLLAEALQRGNHAQGLLLRGCAAGLCDLLQHVRGIQQARL